MICLISGDSCESWPSQISTISFKQSTCHFIAFGMNTFSTQDQVSSQSIQPVEDVATLSYLFILSVFLLTLGWRNQMLPANTILSKLSKIRQRAISQNESWQHCHACSWDTLSDCNKLQIITANSTSVALAMQIAPHLAEYPSHQSSIDVPLIYHHIFHPDPSTSEISQQPQPHSWHT